MIFDAMIKQLKHIRNKTRSWHRKIKQERRYHQLIGSHVLTDKDANDAI